MGLWIQDIVTAWLVWRFPIVVLEWPPVVLRVLLVLLWLVREILRVKLPAR